MSKNIVIHTDGACSGNPGPGGFAAIIEQDGNRITTVTGGDPTTTNNRMEITAVIEALRVLNSIPELRHAPVTVRSDSQYIVNTFNDNWVDGWQRKGWRTAKKQPVANRDLWEALLRQATPHPTKWVWVKGHNGDPMNEECDQLAVAQAAIAPSQPGYWASNKSPDPAAIATQEEAPGEQPRDEAPEPTPRKLRPLQTIEVKDALERNEIAVKALQDALYHQLSGKPEDATANIQKALRHLEGQRKLLANEPLPF